MSLQPKREDSLACREGLTTLSLSPRWFAKIVPKRATRTDRNGVPISACEPISRAQTILSGAGGLLSSPKGPLLPAGAYWIVVVQTAAYAAAYAAVWAREEALVYGAIPSGLEPVGYRLDFDLSELNKQAKGRIRIRIQIRGAELCTAQE